MALASEGKQAAINTDADSTKSVIAVSH